MLTVLLQPVIPTAPSSPQEIFLQQGILGALILVLFGVIVFLVRKVNSTQDKLDALQEKRHDELKVVGERFHAITSESARTMSDLARAIDQQNEQLDEVRRAVERIEHTRRPP